MNWCGCNAAATLSLLPLWGRSRMRGISAASSRDFSRRRGFVPARPYGRALAAMRLAPARRAHFLCLSKENGRKERTPQDAAGATPPAPRLTQGAHPCAPARSCASSPCAFPSFGASQTVHPCTAAKARLPGFARFAASFLRSAPASLGNWAYHPWHARSMLRISPSLGPVLGGVQGDWQECGPNYRITIQFSCRLR